MPSKQETTSENAGDFRGCDFNYNVSYLRILRPQLNTSDLKFKCLTKMYAHILTDIHTFALSLMCYSPAATSSLCSLLLLKWQRQVANFLPFDLQQFPSSKKTEPPLSLTHTHTHHTQRRSLSWPGWTRAEVLQKEGKWRSFKSGTRVILAVPNLTRWMTTQAHQKESDMHSIKCSPILLKTDLKMKRMISRTLLANRVLRKMCSFIIWSSLHTELQYIFHRQSQSSRTVTLSATCL